MLVLKCHGIIPSKFFSEVLVNLKIEILFFKINDEKKYKENILPINQLKITNLYILLDKIRNNTIPLNMKKYTIIL